MLHTPRLTFALAERGDIPADTNVEVALDLLEVAGEQLHSEEAG